MDFTLGKEIYGNPWYMDYISMQSFAGILNNIQNGINVEKDTEKCNFLSIYDIKQKVNTTEDIYNAKNNPDNEYVSIINLNGPITKNGGMSHYGTKEISQELLRFDSLDNIKGHILKIESGGGSVNAIPVMSEAIKSLRKPIVTFVDGMMASAAMYIGSFTPYIIAGNKNDWIGSIGTMIEMAGYPQQSEDKNDGFRNVRIYADKSFNKNKEFEAAINDLNFKPVKDKILNPHNEIFINDMRQNRPNIREIETTGEIFKAGDVIGTLIDAIGTFEDAVNKVLELSKGNNASSGGTNINQKTNKMTKDELKSQHPEVYNEIYAEGVTSERTRSKAWMAFSEIDPEAVKKGIESNAVVDQSVMAEMSVKQVAKINIASAAAENAPEVDPSKKEEKPEDVEAKKLQAEVRAYMNLKPLEDK